jgi:hypothetical protein
MEVGCKRQASATLPAGMPRSSLYRKLGEPWTGLEGCGKSRLSTGILFPERSAYSESLYRLS